MKFSDIQASDWESLKPYLDTCLLPVTGLKGDEPPWRTTEALERLRDVMDPVEHAYKGRMVTYPAFHYYTGAEGMYEQLAELCAQLKKNEFKHVVLITPEANANELSAARADAVLTAETISNGTFKSVVENVWSGQK